MLLQVLLTAALVLAQTPASMGEPDGSHTIGIVPPFHGEPAPPEWLRSTSSALAFTDTQHYTYEAYAGGDDQWLVRYVMLPEGNEAYREIEQVFLFGKDPKKKPREIKPSEIQYDARKAVWKGHAFALVDRRDLMKP